MQRAIESATAQFAGYGVASLTSAIILAVQRTGIIDPGGIMQIVPQWAVVTSWVLSSAMAVVTMGASAYKKIMEGKAIVISAERDACTYPDCRIRRADNNDEEDA